VSELFLERLDGRLSGEIDVAVASTAETDFLAVALGVPGSTFVVDCAGLTFIDSAGVRMLERVATRSGKRLQLADVPHACRRVFEVLGVCELFGIATPDEAC